MSTHDTNTAPGESAPTDRLSWLLNRFTDTVPGVSHAVLLARDGLKLLHSDMHQDWADKLAAAFSGLASLAQNIPGPLNGKLPPQLLIIEREDALFFLQSSGTSALFKNHPGNQRGTVDTLLGVIAQPDAAVGTVGYEMAHLIDQFAPYMATPVRAAMPSDQARR
ncbi:roadblock/LC7 domain-containing protein [Streptomyces sp. NPDC101213]|uniref:roadblock/LC7 domain-containing protein n=1 Tax=Streptomyces sp. NPDC101213 TaxID=3366130 RepID=UPI00382556F6